MATRSPDKTIVEAAFSRGIVRSTARHLIQPGGVYDAADFLIEQPGVAYKRGGWLRHSLQLGASTSVRWAGTIHLPTRVAAIGSDSNLYDVTSENAAQATLIGAVDWAPAENSPQYLSMLILCDPDGVDPPKKIVFNVGMDRLVILDLGGFPPAAERSTVHVSRIVLARNPVNPNRIWFSPVPDVEDTWDTTQAYIDATYEITALASCQGALLVLSPKNVERIIGGIPPGTEGENMQLQQVAGVGCLDARSVVHWDEQIVFAGEEGVWLCNAAGVESITEPNIQSYWRSLFPRHHGPGEHNFRQLVGGLINRDFYIISVLDNLDAPQATLLCHLPTRAWTRLTNTSALSYAQGRTEQEILELYACSPTGGYVNSIGQILFPGTGYEADGDGTDVEPLLETRALGASPWLKAIGFGHALYDLDTADAAVLEASFARGIDAEDFEIPSEGDDLPATDGMERHRFTVGGDAQCVTVRLQQNGPSATTRVAALELEARSYDSGSEGDGD